MINLYKIKGGHIRCQTTTTNYTQQELQKNEFTEATKQVGNYFNGLVYAGISARDAALIVRGTLEEVNLLPNIMDCLESKQSEEVVSTICAMKELTCDSEWKYIKDAADDIACILDIDVYEGTLLTELFTVVLSMEEYSRPGKTLWVSGNARVEMLTGKFAQLGHTAFAYSNKTTSNLLHVTELEESGDIVNSILVGCWIVNQMLTRGLN